MRTGLAEVIELHPGVNPSSGFDGTTEGTVDPHKLFFKWEAFKMLRQEAKGKKTTDELMVSASYVVDKLYETTMKD